MRWSTAVSVCGDTGGGAGCATAGVAPAAGGGPTEGAGEAAGGGIGALAAADARDCARLAHGASEAARAAPSAITRIGKRIATF